MTMKDTIVEEVRNVRTKIEADCKRRGISLYDYYLQEQEKSGGRLVNRGPRFLYRDVGDDAMRKVAEPSAVWITKQKKGGRSQKTKT
jgi:hypothetical protein